MWLTYINDLLTCCNMLCLLQLSRPQLQHVLLPLHHRSLQVLLARAEQDPEIFLRSTHGIVLLHQMILISITIVDNLNAGAWLGLVALCARNFHASQRLLLRLPLSLCGQVFFVCFLPILLVFVCLGDFSPSLTPTLPMFCGDNKVLWISSFLDFLHLQRVSNGKHLVEVMLWKWENMKIPPYSYYLSHVSNDVFVVISLFVVTSDFKASFFILHI